MKLVDAIARTIRYNKRTECSETAYKVKVTTAAILIRYTCYVMSMTVSFTIFLLRYLGAKYDSPETKKHTSPPSTSCLTKPVLTNCLILSNSRYNTNFYAWTMWPSYPMGVTVLPRGVGQDVFIATFCEIVHLIWV